MKKSKPLSLHHIQTTSPSQTKKKSPSSIKSKTIKSPLTKKSTQSFKPSPQPEDYIIINDNIYSANTFTQRNCYDQFLTKVKKQKQQQRKSFLYKPNQDDSQSSKLKKTKDSTKKKFKKLLPEDLIKCMTLDEKREMFYKLQQEIKSSKGGNNFAVDLPSLTENNKESQPCSTESFEQDLSQRMRMDSERERDEKFHILEEKLQSLKMQLLFKWEGQLQKLQQLFRKGKISEKQKQNKCIIIQKLKDHKLKIIECTKTLFQKILQQDNNEEQQNQKKNNKIQAILQSLHSLPSLQSLQDQQILKQPNIDHLKANQKAKINQKKPLFQNESNTNSNKLKTNENNGNEQAINKNSFYKNKIISTAADSSPLEVVQDNMHEAFLSDFNQDIETKKIKIRQQLMSPLNFMNNSPNKDRFGQFQEVNTIVNTGYNNLPSRSEEMLRQLLELGQVSKDKKQTFSQFSGQNVQNSGKLSLKLDLRLDEIVFGQDEYPQCEKNQIFKAHLDSKMDNLQNKGYKLDFKIDEYLSKGRVEYQQGLSPNKYKQERITREKSKANKKRSLIQFTEQQEEPIQQEQKQTIQQSKPIVEIVNKISLNNKLEQKEVINHNDKAQQQKISLAEISQNKKYQQPKTTVQPFQLKLPLNLSYNQVTLNKETLNKETLNKETLNKEIFNNETLNKQQESSIEQIPQLIPPPIQTSQQDEQLDQLECHQVSNNIKPTIDIPMLLSQQKMETLALQQNRLFRQNVDRRIAFQMGCIQLESSTTLTPHFTTLVDINSYIVGLYQFMMKKYMESLVDSLNVPYGKSAIDKLYSLHSEGFVLQESYNQMNNILSESHFVEYQREMTLTVRKCSQYQTAHNRAVFQTFTKSINVYRPYYQLEGEVFPWIVSEKGITFYEITEDNIEEVFEKSKIKVLQYCTSLCGIHSPAQAKNQQQSAIVNNKNEENLNKIIKAETLQQFEEWKIRFVNFDCLIKLLLGKLIEEQIVNQVISEIEEISNKRKILGE